MRLIVTQDARHTVFEAVIEGATGAAVCGRGASPLEAIGAWAMNYFADGGDWAGKHNDPCLGLPLEVICDPPELLETFRFHPRHASWSKRMTHVLGPADKRD